MKSLLKIKCFWWLRNSSLVGAGHETRNLGERGPSSHLLTFSFSFASLFTTATIALNLKRLSTQNLLSQCIIELTEILCSHKSQEIVACAADKSLGSSHDRNLLEVASMEDTTVGIIGMGDMGKMYARRISEAGWK